MTDELLPLVVVVPILTAAAIAAVGHLTPNVLDQALALAASAATTVLCALALANSGGATPVHWFGGWEPRDGAAAVGIAFTGDPLGIGAATFIAALATVALAVSYRYFEEAGHLFSVLMLTLLAGMVGFVLAGDLFTLFALLELMSVAAFALTGFRIESTAPIQGALNFAVTNAIGALMLLLATALLYGETGALNLAQLGRTLAGHPDDGLLVVALTLLAAGLLVKAAVVPFHFWLADAYAVAPAPVCVLLAAVMSELGLFGLVRVFWTVFEPAIGAPAGLERTLLVLGVGTALLGAAMAFLQRHLKRMLAYVTIFHVGVVLTGIAALDAESLAGVLVDVLAFGPLVAALFLLAGMLHRRFGSTDELDLYGRGRAAPAAAVVALAAAAGVAGVPPVGTFVGRAMHDDAAVQAGHTWLPWVLAVASAVAAAALLRAFLRIFFGVGPSDDPMLNEQPEDPTGEGESSGIALLLAAAALTVSGLVVGLVPGVQQHAEEAARRATEPDEYAARVLRGETNAPAHVVVDWPHVSGASVAVGLFVAALAVAIAAGTLGRRRLPRTAGAGLGAVARPIAAAARTVHSGTIGDYVAWITIGTAAIGGALALSLA